MYYNYTQGASQVWTKTRPYYNWYGLIWRNTDQTFVTHMVSMIDLIQKVRIMSELRHGKLIVLIALYLYNSTVTLLTYVLFSGRSQLLSDNVRVPQICYTWSSSWDSLLGLGWVLARGPYLRPLVSDGLYSVSRNGDTLVRIQVTPPEVGLPPHRSHSTLVFILQTISGTVTRYRICMCGNWDEIESGQE